MCGRGWHRHSRRRDPPPRRRGRAARAPGSRAAAARAPPARAAPPRTRRPRAARDGRRSRRSARHRRPPNHGSQNRRRSSLQPAPILLAFPAKERVKRCLTKEEVIPGCPHGAGPEPMNTEARQQIACRCAWVPGSRALPAPRNDRISHFFTRSFTGKAATECSGRGLSLVPSPSHWPAPRSRGPGCRRERR